MSTTTTDHHHHQHTTKEHAPMSKSTATLTLTARQLRSLVNPVLPHVAGVDDMSFLRAVNIVSGGGWVTATATDRYTVGTQRLWLTDAKPGIHAVVPLEGIKAVLSMFGRVSKSNNPSMSLTFTDTHMTVEAAGTIFGGIEAARFNVALHDAPLYPDMTNVWTKAREADRATGPVAINPKLLGRFTAAQTEGEPMVMSPADGVTPFLVTVGDDFIGAVMPMRSDGEGAVTAHTDTGRWADVRQVMASRGGRK